MTVTKEFVPAFKVDGNTFMPSAKAPMPTQKPMMQVPPMAMGGNSFVPSQAPQQPFTPTNF